MQQALMGMMKELLSVLAIEPAPGGSVSLIPQIAAYLTHLRFHALVRLSAEINRLISTSESSKSSVAALIL